MVKEIYLFRGKTGQCRKLFCEEILGEVIPVVLANRPDALKVTLTEKAPPRISVIPFSRDLVACVSVKGPAPELCGQMQKMDHFAGAYGVEEAIPIGYSVDWPLKTPSPGAGLLTLFRKKNGLDYDAFIRRWHEGHTPLSLKLHPLWNYVRNVVSKQMTAAGFAYDGIVEEQVQFEQQLLNPFQFFGPFPKTLVNMITVLKDVRSFIEYSSIETYLVTEYLIKKEK